MTTRKRASRGFSVVELMIGLTLSLFILAALAQAFTFASQSRRSQEATNRLMDNGRTALELLARSVRLASYWGCVGVDNQDLSLHRDATDSADPTGIRARGIFGVDATGTAASQITTWRALDDVTTRLSRTVELRTGETFDGSGLYTPPSSAADKGLFVTSTAGFSENDWVSVNNCAVGDVFKISKVGAGTLTYGSTCTTCSRRQTTGAVVQRILRERFYINPSLSAANRKALWVERNGVAQELIPGIEDMRITYGLDVNADGIVEQYVPASTVNAVCVTDGDATCWSQVAAVRIALLASTVDDGVTTTRQTYQYNGTPNIQAQDRRLRREFVSVLSVRNIRR